MDAPGTLLAGEIGKPFGLDGEVYVVRISDDPRRFERGNRLIHANGRTLEVERARAHGNRWLVKFYGVDDRDSAETLRGPVFVAVDEVRELEPDEFWPHELVGCTVALANGDVIGTVERVVPGAAHDLLAVATSGGERLVPTVKDIIVEVDIPARRVTIDPPEGLVD